MSNRERRDSLDGDSNVVEVNRDDESVARDVVEGSEDVGFLGVTDPDPSVDARYRRSMTAYCPFE